MSVDAKDREILRELASQVAEIAALPAQQKVISLWKACNGLKPIRPMVSIDQVCWHEMDVDGELILQSEGGLCRRLETSLRRTLYSWKHMRVDAPVEPVVEVHKVIRGTGFGIETRERRAVLDPLNSVVGHLYIDQLETEADLEKIRTTEIVFDEQATNQTLERTQEIFDGILSVRLQGVFPTFAPWDRIVQWHGVENSLLDLVDRPEFIHQIMSRLTDAMLSQLDQFEEQGLLGYGQRTIHCTGAQSDELPAPGFDSQRPRTSDLWTCGMAQIFSSVSPDTHQEFELAYANRWYERFGLVYYGCCEPLDAKMDIVRRIPHVRKISMSPWVDVERAAEQIGGSFVFSRKPSPAFLAQDTWSAEAVERDLRETLDCCAAHGCPLEFVLKDISTVRYQPQRLWEWADIAMKVVGG